MQSGNPSLNFLAQRVREGDVQAKVQLHEQLEPNLARIVRRVLARGSASTRLEHKILAAAQRLAPCPGALADAAPVAHNLCQKVLNRLWPGSTEAPLEATCSNLP